MINSYSKIISENSSLSKKTKQKNLNENKNINNNNENSNEIEDFNIEKDFSINEEVENIEKPLNDRKGNTIMFFYTKNLFPLILIGPHCKIIIKIIKLLLLFL